MSSPVSSIPSVIWRRLAALVLLGLLVAIAFTFRDYGISWDELVQQIYGDDLIAFYATGGADRDALAFMNLFFYGGFFDMVAASLNHITPFSVWDTRHLWGAVLSLIGLIGAYRLGALLASARAGFFAVVMLGIQSLMY